MLTKIKSILFCLLLLAASCLSAKEDSIIFRHTFQNGLVPDYAAGNPTPVFLGEEDDIAFAEGLVGQGFLTGRPGQSVRFRAEGNFPQEQGTVVFWARGLPGTSWNKMDERFYWHFEYFGGGGWIRLYKYYQYAYTFLLSNTRGRINLPNGAYTEDEWNMYAFTWNSNNRMSFYINGIKIGEHPDFFIPEVNPNAYFRIGQSAGEGEENRVMDNLTIYAKSLTNYDIMNIYLSEGEIALQQRLHIPKTGRPVVIDGEIDDAEWENSAVVPLSIDNSKMQVTDTISYLRMMYDDKALYLALTSPIPAEDLAEVDERLLYGFFKRDALQDGGPVQDDDSFRIDLLPEGGTRLYRMMVNTIGTLYSHVEKGDGEIDTGWTPDVDSAVVIGDEGFTLEIRIPFDSLSGAAPLPGAVWQANFLRIWQQLRQQEDSWTLGRRLPGSTEMSDYSVGNIVFGDGESLSVNALSVDGLENLFPAVHMKLLNPGDEMKEAILSLSTEVETLVEKSVVVEPGEAVNFEWIDNLAEKHPAIFAAMVSDKNTGEIYYSFELPLYAERLVDVNLRSYPSYGILKIEGNAAALDLPAEELRIRVSMLKGGVPAKELSFTPGSVFFEEEVDISGLEPAAYDVNVEFSTGGEDPVLLARQETVFIKSPLPEWHGNTLGISEKVPEPWTPLKVADGEDVISCWNRRYHTGGSLLFSQIETGQLPLLSRPISLVLSGSGGSVDLNDYDVARSFSHKSDARVEWNTSIPKSGVNVELNSFIEFDGMVWTEITLGPVSGDVEIDSLKLSIPIRAEAATLINPYDYSLRTTGYFPEGGWTGVSRHVWFGNEEGGIQLFSEHSYTTDAARQGDETVVEIFLIGSPIVLEGEIKFGVGLMATPVKRMHPDYRKWRIGHPDSLVSLTPEQDIEMIAAWSPNWSKTGPHLDFYPIPRENIGESRFHGQARGRRYYRFAYYMLHEAWVDTDEFRQFGDEWLRDFRASVVEGRDRISVCQNSFSHRDFVLHGFNLLQEQASPRGYYFDVSRPGSCNNIHHGCGYIDVNGTIQPTFNILGAREMAKRIYTHLKEHRDDGMIIYHNSGQVLMPLHGFADILADGENTYARLDRRDNRGYENFLTLDTYRAEYMGHNFGASVALLPQFTRAGSIMPDEAEEVGPRHAEYILGLTLLHDSQLWIAYFYDNQPLKDLYSALAEQEFATVDYSFVPYWNQEITNRMGEDEAVVSFYVDDARKRALMVFMNMSGEEKPFSLDIDSSALGFVPASAGNLCHDETVVIEGASLGISSVPSHTYRLVLLEAD